MWQYAVFFTVLHFASGYLGPMMGVQNQCDDGKNNLYVDWNPADYSSFTCLGQQFAVRQDVAPLAFDLKTRNSSFNPKTDVVFHQCMTETIKYDFSPPLRGNHRPNWARYGEYLYVPEQRWLHNLEHGAIILLYHPCADQEELRKLRSIVTKCLYRHVITPYNKLSDIRPFALISWGSKLEMNYVDEIASVAFIKAHARIAPEDLSKDGIYDTFLIRPAKVVSDEMDTNICNSAVNHVDTNSSKPFLISDGPY